MGMCMWILQTLARGAAAAAVSLFGELHRSAAGQAAAKQAAAAWNTTANVLLHDFTMASANARICCPLFFG